MNRCYVSVLIVAIAANLDCSVTVDCDCLMVTEKRFESGVLELFQNIGNRGGRFFGFFFSKSFAFFLLILVNVVPIDSVEFDGFGKGVDIEDT